MRDKATAHQIYALTNAVITAIKQPSDNAFYLGYLTFCQRQGELDSRNINQFRYQGRHYHSVHDNPIRNAPMLNPKLVEEFKPLYQFYVVELEELLHQVKYMLGDLVRIAHTHEEIIRLLPISLHEAVENITYTTVGNKRLTDGEADEFLSKYVEVFPLIDVRVFLGALS